MIVILLSSLAQVRARVRGLRTGADDYIGKPYEAPYLIARARQLLRGRRAQPAAPSVLVIDDSATFREHLRQILQGAGYAAFTAVSGENGLRLAADLRPAAILVDGEMPGMDGLSVLRRLRMDSALRHTPCLMLTAAEGGEVAALDCGADAFVRKSEGGDVVLARLAALLRHAGPAAGTPGASLMGPKKILAVDEDEIFLGRLMADLKRDGFEVVPAPSGEEALELLEAESMDCVLLGAPASGPPPCLDALQTCRRLKAGPATRGLPVIILTQAAESVMEALAAGADDALPKSGDFEVLRARLLAQVRRKFLEDENRQSGEQIPRRP